MGVRAARLTAARRIEIVEVEPPRPAAG